MQAARVSRVPFQVATFLGSGLLFLIQPLVAKQILPWFGGGSAVWSACLLFFQLGLVGGYAYAHFTRRLGPVRQATLHLILLAIAFLTLPVSPGNQWKPPDGDALVMRVLWLLTVNVALPYVLLAATAPLLQDWFARISPPPPPPVVTPAPVPLVPEPAGDVLLETLGPPLEPSDMAPPVSPLVKGPLAWVPEAPYQLYVVSNIGSLLALVAYPTLLEPSMALRRQQWLWAGIFVAFVLACAWCARVVRRHPIVDAAEAVDADAAVSPIDKALWVLLPAIGSGLLLATTGMLTQDVASVPMLWIVPLALYLITYILAFAGFYWRIIWGPAYLATIFLAIRTFRDSSTTTALEQGLVLVGMCTAGCLVCHGELVRLRPRVGRLTSFYLATSIGGCLGGAFVALAAPVLFTRMLELPILHALAIALLAAFTVRRIRGWIGLVLRAVAPAGAVAGIAYAASGVFRTDATDTTVVRDIERSYYGIVRVIDEPAVGVRRLYHGRILHGLQFTSPSLTTLATSYYGVGTGVEIAIREHPRRIAGDPLKIGVVGLGTGTVAGWAHRGDLVHYFEIDPKVIAVSQRNFTFIRDSAADVEIVRGDARLSLEREMATPDGPHSYDVIAVDAFSGDAIPVHLLTDEAFALYEQALKPDGILALHVSNRFLDLRAVVRGIAAKRGVEALEIFKEGSAATRTASSNWMLVTKNAPFLDATRGRATPEFEESRRIIWTDDFSSLIPIWKSQ